MNKHAYDNIPAVADAKPVVSTLLDPWAFSHQSPTVPGFSGIAGGLPFPSQYP